MTSSTTPDVTITQVLLVALVFGFTGWLITNGFTPHSALLVTGGGITIASGLSVLPRGIIRFAAALKALP